MKKVIAVISFPLMLTILAREVEVMVVVVKNVSRFVEKRRNSSSPHTRNHAVKYGRVFLRVSLGLANLKFVKIIEKIPLLLIKQPISSLFFKAFLS